MKIESEGKSYFNNEIYLKKSIRRHLSSQLKKQEKGYSGREASSYHIQIIPKYDFADLMFIHLWVKSSVTFADIDRFLRQIWLECCGHMSAFTDEKLRHAERFSLSLNDKRYPGEIDKGKKIKDEFQPNRKLQYEYDFGSSTVLDVVLVKEYAVSAPKSIVLLSRNEPLYIPCSECNEKPAVTMCSVDYEYFCKTCSKKHKKKCEDFADYAKQPVVNSPRLGVCGYMGGEIDKKRDGFFVEK